MKLEGLILKLSEQHAFLAALDLPGINNKSVRDGGIIFGPHRTEKAAVRVIVQYTGIRRPRRAGNPVFNGCDGAARTPYIIHDQDPPAAQQLVVRELDELGPGQQA